MKKKNKKGEHSNKSELNKKIIESMEELLQQATVVDYRKALTDLFFEAAMIEDRPLSFPIWAYRIQSLIHFFDSIDKNVDSH